MGRGRRKKKTRSDVPSAPESKPPAPSRPQWLMNYCHNSRRFFVYYLDFTTGADDGFMRPLYPRFCLDGLSTAQLCIFNSILYVFELCEFDGDVRKSVYSLDLSASLNEPESSPMAVVEKSMLVECSEMKSTKTNAQAIVTPGGKIMIYILPQFSGGSEFDFELFDPVTKQCRALPQLPSRARMFVKRSEFLSSSVFMITTDLGRFYIDLDGSDNGWRWREDIVFGSLHSSFLVTHRVGDGRGGDVVRLPRLIDSPLSRLPDSIRRRFRADIVIPYSIYADKEIIVLYMAQHAYIDDRPFMLFDVYISDISDPARKEEASFRFMGNHCLELCTY